MERQFFWLGYVCAGAAAASCTLIGLVMAPRFDIVNIAMVYLLAVVVIALRFSRGAAVVCAVLCVAAFDFTFVPPAGTLTVHDIQYLLTFAIMLSVALVISGLMQRARRNNAKQAALTVAVHCWRRFRMTCAPPWR
jgi:two-component system, OmpR family, sensor histidine kinase KdpD